MRALGAVKEGWRPGDQQIQTGKSSRVNFINELSQSVQTLIANVTANSLDGLDLIENNQQTGVAGISEHT